MDTKYQFFISSTYRDLVEERQLAINAIMKSSHIPAGMELFSATGEQQFESIKPIIMESDYYLLILGGKYGTIIDKENISYTEKEFDYALSINKRIIAFVYNDPENLPSHKRETQPAMISLFNNFRVKVLNNRMVSMWKSKIDLIQNIVTSINNIIYTYPAKTHWVHVTDDYQLSNTSNKNNFKKSKTETIIITSANQYTFLNNGISEVFTSFKTNEEGNTLKLTFNINPFDIEYKEYRYISLRINSLPKYDWRRYLLNNSCIKFSLMSTENIENFYFIIETDRFQISETKIELKKGVLKDCVIYLGQYAFAIDYWILISAIYFKLYPAPSDCYEGEISIYNLRIES